MLWCQREIALLNHHPNQCTPEEQSSGVVGGDFIEHAKFACASMVNAGYGERSKGVELEAPEVGHSSMCFAALTHDKGDED